MSFIMSLWAMGCFTKRTCLSFSTHPRLKQLWWVVVYRAIRLLQISKNTVCFFICNRGSDHHRFTRGLRLSGAKLQFCLILYICLMSSIGEVCLCICSATALNVCNLQSHRTSWNVKPSKWHKQLRLQHFFFMLSTSLFKCFLTLQNNF